MSTNHFDDIPIKPTGINALTKNNELNKQRFESSIPTIPLANTTQTHKILRQQKPKYKVASYRLLEEDINYVSNLAKQNKVPTRDVIKTIIEFYKGTKV